MSDRRAFMWLLLVTLPISLILWLVNAFVSSATGVDAVEPLRWLAAIIMPIVVARWGLSRRSLSISGAASGLFVGFLLTLGSYVFLVNLLVFFVSSSKATKFKSHEKRKFEDNFKEGLGVRKGSYASKLYSYPIHLFGGERNWVQVMCNGGVAALMAWFYIVDCGCGESPIDLVYNYRCSWLNIAILGAIACCNGDTWASEIGTVLGKGDPFLITSLQPVPKGTNGGVTVVGLVLSLFGGLVIGLGHYLSLIMLVSSSVLLSAPPQWPIVVVGALGGLLGSLIDSVLGATVQFSGIDSHGKIVEHPGEGVVPICGSNILDNHAVNLISSLLTACLLPRVALMIM